MRSRWHLRANSLVVAWLLVAAGVAVAHRWVPAAGWLMVHALLLGAVSTAILVWSAHFAEAVRRAPLRGGHRGQAIRLAGHTAGAVAVITGLLSSTWPLVVTGAALVAGGATWHAVLLVGLGRRSLGVRLGWTTWYFVAAAAALPAGAALGALLARATAVGELAARAYVAHVVVMLLGWVGLTVMGTLVTLWPTMLRVRLDDDALPAARQGLGLLLVALAVVAAGALVGPPAVAGAGLVLYLLGLLRALRPLAAAARSRRPDSFGPWSVAAAIGWLLVTVAVWAGAVGTAADWPSAQARLGGLLAAPAVGFAAQVLLGALAHLVPMVLGGGPAAVRAARAVAERGAAARVVLVNGGLLAYLLATPSLVRVATSVLVLGALVATPVLLVRAAVVSVRRRAETTGPVAVAAAELLTRTRGTGHGSAVAALGALVLVVAGGVAADPAAAGLGRAATGDVRATGAVVEVAVEAGDMRFEPASVTVSAGDRLVLVVTNADAAVHDLVLDSGASSGRLAPGATARLDVGVVGRALAGWCSVAGHRQMGMTFDVVVLGATAAPGGPGAPGPDSADAADDGSPHHTAAARPLDLLTPPGPLADVRDARLAPAPDGTVHRVRLVVQERRVEVAPGLTQTLWTFGGTAPGPTLRGRVGDTFVVTLVNDGTIGHSIDFHAGALAPDRPMRTIAPGEELTYTFTATRSGVWMYHCSTMPMSLHIANGMHGAVVVDPPDLPPVDREYLLVQHELYPGQEEADAAAVTAERPAAVVFNGHATQYRHAPLVARVGERVRIWVLDAGPNRPSAFHVVGGQFDTVYAEGAWLLGGPGAPPGGTGGAQVLGLLPAQGGFVELVLPEAGRYPFVSHLMVDAERGAAGVLDVRD